MQSFHAVFGLDERVWCGPDLGHNNFACSNLSLFIQFLLYIAFNTRETNLYYKQYLLNCFKVIQAFVTQYLKKLKFNDT